MLHVVENIAVTQSHSRSFAFTPLSRAWVSSYWYSIVTMVISFDRKRDIVENHDFLSPSIQNNLWGKRFRLSSPKTDPWPIV